MTISDWYLIEVEKRYLHKYTFIVSQSVVFRVVLVIFILGIFVCPSRITAFDYLFDIFKLFLFKQAKCELWAVVVVIGWLLDLQLPVQSVPIITKVVSSKPDQWFSPDTPVSSTNKTDRFDRSEIVFKVALNTIILTPNISLCSPIMLLLNDTDTIL